MNVERNTILPWQQSIWEQLWRRKQASRLPHALLFSGIEGVGKRYFAEQFANAILCVAPKQIGSCGTCRACHLLQARSHPDLLCVEPEEAGQMIKIDQIRQVVHFVSETPLFGGYRVIIIEPAAAMNMNAVNALLKTLEEPTPNTILILISNQSLRLPATIVSRCQKIIFSKPVEAVALSWLKNDLPEADAKLLLKISYGAPLKAKQIFTSEQQGEDKILALRQDLYQGLVQLSQQQSSPLHLAAQWQEKNLVLLLNFLQTWLKDLLRFHLTGDTAGLINDDYHAVFVKLNQKIRREKLLHYLDYFQNVYAKIIRSLNLNKQLVLEELFIRWMQLCS